MKRFDWLHWTLLSLLLLTLAAGALTPYRYFKAGSGNTLTRVSRISGEAERLTSSGWKPMGPGLEAKYPHLADKVREARSEGYSDEEQEAFIQSRTTSSPRARN